MKKEELDIIVPVALETDWGSRETIAESILEQNKRFGFTKFALAMPGKGWRSVSYPPEEYFLEKAKLFLAVKKALPEYIRCGWWHTLVLKSGPTPGFARVVRQDGTEAPFSSCPLDPGYRKRFSDDVASVIRIARPDFLLLEDDFGMNCHGGPGCFCPRHLEEFARREGRFYSREELRDLFENSPLESRELLRRFQSLQKDSLVLFAQAIRSAADREAPEISIGYDQPGCSMKDGDSVEAVARALAGKNHRPWARFCGTLYGMEQISRTPAILFPCLYFKQHIPDDFGFYHESDSYPHTRFMVSASAMRVFMSAAYSFGYGGSVFQTQQILDDPNEEKAYGAMFAEERKRFNALHQAVRNCRVRGVHVPFVPFDAVNFPKQGPAWAGVLSAMGIPYTTDKADISFVSGDQLLFADDRMIRGYLSKGLFLDGPAARVLCSRGYGEYLGVDVQFPLIEGMEKYDLEAREVIRPDFLKGNKGRNMHRGDVFSPLGNGDVFKLIPSDPGCETVTEIVTFRREPMAPGMTRFRNRLGGRVVVCASEVNGNASSSLFNYRRQKLFQELILWCSDSVAFVKNEPRVFCIVNEAPEDEDFRYVLTLIDLCPDPLAKLELHLPPDGRESVDWKIMDHEGVWQDAPVKKTGDGILLDHPLPYTEPVYLMAAKKQ